MANFEAAIPTVLKHEGGFVDDKADPGGATNYGISLRYLKAQGELVNYDFDGDSDVDADDVRKMTREQACQIYQSCWWDKYGYAQINSQMIANKLFDMAVNMGQGQAAKLAQRACNRLSAGSLAVDGLLGQNTLTIINGCNPSKLLDALRSECASFYLNLIMKKPSLKKFEKGWLNRAYA